METGMQVINTILVLIFLLFLIIYISALRNPKQKSLVKSFGENPTRKSISQGFLPIIGVLFILIGITAPPTTASTDASSQSVTQQREAEAKKSQEEARLKAIEDAKPKVKQETSLVAIPFDTENTDDPSLPKGQQKVTREGSDGKKSVTYDVTYENGKETARTVKQEIVITAPTSKIITNGTYVAPASTYSSGGSGYTNSQGNHVDSPSSNPAGASAQCRDGTYSYSQSRSGTCSHHGGVAVWY